MFAPLPHPYYAYTLREQGFADVVGQLQDGADAGTLDAAIDCIPDELVDRLVIAGTPAECRARLAEYDGLLDEMLLLNAMPGDRGNVLAAYAPLLELIAARPS